MYTKELLLNSSSMSRVLGAQGKKLKGVLTSSEQSLLAALNRSFQVIRDDKVFWFTDDYCMMTNIQPEKKKKFSSSSTGCPHDVVSRPEVPSGVVRTVEEYISVYQKGRRQITTIDELVDYLNGRLKV